MEVNNEECMAKASDKKEILYQNLVDAGCDEETVKECMNCSECGNWNEMLSILSGQKKHLLDVKHNNQKHIDCLDYLTYKVEKENRK